eukprot:COSAG01_NODE_5062_length_4518_cov_2.300294_3_plen_330_part_01
MSKPRTNIERANANKNYIDPSDFKPRLRDLHPKMDLSDGFLGDRYPVCSAMPSRAFLRVGATYVYRGRKFTSRNILEGVGTTYAGQATNAKYDGVNGVGWDDGALENIEAAATSSLYQALCGTASAGQCTYPSEVTLSSNLPCSGSECLIDTLRVVKITDADETVFYEHVPQPCVRMAFYQNAKIIKEHNPRDGNMLCADPLEAVAGVQCCQANDYSGNADGVSRCQYSREHVTFSTAQQRCQQTGQYYNQFNPTSVRHVKVAYGGTDRAGNAARSGTSCVPETEPHEVRCCSDTAIAAQPGDNPNQNYWQPAANTLCGQRLGAARPWVN